MSLMRRPTSRDGRAERGRASLHANSGYTWVASTSTDDLLAAIRRLPLDERRRLIERATQDADEDTPKPAAVGASPAPSLLGLMGDQPELVDEMCSLVYKARSTARMRTDE